jgi:hypothetical protein
MLSTISNRTWVLLLALVLVFTLVACGGETNEPAPAADTPAEPAAPADTPADTPPNRPRRYRPA